MMMRDIEMPACEIVLKKCELSKGILIQKTKTLNYTPFQNFSLIHRAETKRFLFSSQERKTAENNDHKSRYVKKRRKNIQFVFLLLITLS